MQQRALRLMAGCVGLCLAVAGCNQASGTANTQATPGAPAANPAGQAANPAGQAAVPVADANGLIVQETPNDVVTTLSRINKLAPAKNYQTQLIVVSTNVDPKSPKLRPSRMITLFNPQIDGLMVRKGPTFALELPLKMLAYESIDGKRYLVYQDPVFMARRHGIDPADPLVKLLSDIFRDLAIEGLKPVAPKLAGPTITPGGPTPTAMPAFQYTPIPIPGLPTP